MPSEAEMFFDAEEARLLSMLEGTQSSSGFRQFGILGLSTAKPSTLRARLAQHLLGRSRGLDHNQPQCRMLPKPSLR